MQVCVFESHPIAIARLEIAVLNRKRVSWSPEREQAARTWPGCLHTRSRLVRMRSTSLPVGSISPGSVRPAARLTVVTFLALGTVARHVAVATARVAGPAPSCTPVQDPSLSWRHYRQEALYPLGEPRHRTISWLSESFGNAVVQSIEFFRHVVGQIPKNLRSACSGFF